LDMSGELLYRGMGTDLRHLEGIEMTVYLGAPIITMFLPCMR
jgi:hypothetical protein